MKITALSASSPPQDLKNILQEKCRSDQFVVLEQVGAKLNIDTPEVSSADLLILNYPDIDHLDWSAIEIFNLRHPHSTTVLLIGQGDMERILVQAMRVGVRDVLDSAEISERLPEVIERARSRLAAALGNRAAGKILTFIPCKGGGGTSFIASNLAYVLGEVHHKRVLLIDLDLQFGDASFYITDSDDGRSLGDVIRKPNLDGQMLEAACVQVGKSTWLLRAPSNPEQSVGITPEQIDNILTLGSRQFDFICIDLERTLDPLSLRAMDRSDLIFPIMQTVLPYVRGTQRLQRTFRALHYPESKIRIIVNRQGNSKDLSVEKIEEALHTKFYMHLPNDFHNASTSINAGKPLYEIAPDGVLTLALIRWADQLVGAMPKQEQPAASSFWRKIASIVK
jgi:pilus assembly protein CpaE